MSTALVLSNNRLLINVDYNLQIKDLYYPYIGQYNQLNKYVNQMFFMVDGELIMVNADTCKIDLDYAHKACIGEMVLTIKKYELELHFTDLVLNDSDVYIRDFQIINKGSSNRQVKVFFQNNFALNESIFADTAVWYQPAGCVLHYKKDVYLAIGSREKLYQFTCAAKSDYEGKGAFPLPSGELPYNPVATGDVSSCISFNFDLKAKQSATADYFIAAATNLEGIKPLVNSLRASNFNELRQKTADFWHTRLAPALADEAKIKTELAKAGGELFAENTYKLYWKSLMLMLTQIDEAGAVIAANDGQFLKLGGTDSYSYFWPRDAANVAMALIKAGLQNEARQVLAYALNISGDRGYFLHKYFPGTTPLNLKIGSSWHPWIDQMGNEVLPIQEDATTLILIAVGQYHEQFTDKSFILDHWNAIAAILKFLKAYTLELSPNLSNSSKYVTGFTWNKTNQQFSKSALPYPSFDIWEQYYGVFTYTVITVLEALKVGVELSGLANAKDLQDELIGYARDLNKVIMNELYDSTTQTLIKGIRLETETGNIIKDNSADASLLFAATLSQDPALSPLLDEVSERLQTELKIPNEVGGWARKTDDHYLKLDENFTGNPWAICSLWAAQHYINNDKIDLAVNEIAWVNQHADKTGLIAEQFDPNTGFGMGMKPLTWSQAEYVKAVMLLVEKAETDKPAF